MKNKTCLAVLVRWDSSDIFHSLSLFSLHFSLLFLRAYFPFFLSLSPLWLFQKETIHACDTYAGTEEPIKPNYSCIRHCSSSFFYTIPVQCVYIYIYIFLFIVRGRQFVNETVNIDTRDKMINFTFSFLPSFK